MDWRWRVHVLTLMFVMGLAQVHLSSSQNSIQDYLYEHNKARSVVGSAPLKWNTTLEKYALDYSKKRSKDCELIHSEGPYGENLYWGSGDESFTSGTAGVRGWLTEKELYNYESNECVDGQDCLHYTQIVWNTTETVGCARVLCANKDGDSDAYFLTCEYDPPGNWDGEWPY